MITRQGNTLEFGTAQLEITHAKALDDAIYNHQPVTFEYAETVVQFEPQIMVLSTKGPKGHWQIHAQQLGEFLGELDGLLPMLHTTDRERIKGAVEVATRFGGIDGAHHKAWVIDQMLKHLLGDAYQQTIQEIREEGRDWDEGIAP